MKLAKEAGFCMGVRRAMEIVLSEASKGEESLFTYGPLIHNEQVLNLLETKGIRSVDDPLSLAEGKIVVRAHGIPPQQREMLRKSGLKIINATCPRVARVQAIIRYHTKRGLRAIIVGDKDHAEVIGLLGYCETPSYVIKSPEETKALPSDGRYFAVAQTTQNQDNFNKIVEALKRRYPDVVVFNTICDATFNRQQEVRSLAKEVDAVVVVGGYHSGNTIRLAQVAMESGKPTFHVETENDLEKEKLAGMEVVGVTAGASTPNWMIKNVVKEIEGIRGKKDNFLIRGLNNCLKTLVISNLLAASGAFSFAYAVSLLLGVDRELRFPLLAFFYIYAMHVLNRFLDRGASAYNDPERASFLKKHKLMLICTGILAMGGAIGFAWDIGIRVFLAVCFLSTLGIIYSLPVIPQRFRTRYRYSRMKDIPGSKSLSEAMAWAAIIAVLPLLTVDSIPRAVALIAVAEVLLISYTRSVIFEIFQLQGDLIVGSETLPITLGEKKTIFLLKVILSTGGIMTFLPFVLGLGDLFSIIFLFPVAGLSLCLIAYEKQWVSPGLNFEGLVESNFFITGLMAVLWRVSPWFP